MLCSRLTPVDKKKVNGYQSGLEGGCDNCRVIDKDWWLNSIINDDSVNMSDVEPLFDTNRVLLLLFGLHSQKNSAAVSANAFMNFSWYFLTPFSLQKQQIFLSFSALRWPCNCKQVTNPGNNELVLILILICFFLFCLFSFGLFFHMTTDHTVMEFLQRVSLIP